MSGAVEKLFGHMPSETRRNIAGVIRKEAFAIIGRRRLDATVEWEEGEDWSFLIRKAAQYMAVATWIEDQ